MRTDRYLSDHVDCRGYQCTIEKALPFAGPLLALAGMFVIAATTTAAVVMMAG